MLHSAIVAINNRVLEATDTVGLRPLTARSIVLSILLGSRPPQLPVAALVEFTTLFGIAAGACRTALSRMVANGELDSVDGGYRLGPSLLERQYQQQVGRSASSDPWDGTWWFSTVIADRRTVAERRLHRQRMSGARFGELRPDTWLRPANVPAPTGLQLLTRGPVVSGDEIELVHLLWDLGDLDRRAEALMQQLDVTGSELRAGGEVDDALPTAFVVLAATLRHLRTEPQLPASLAPTAGPARLRELYAEVERAFQERLAGFFARRNVTVSPAPGWSPGLA